MQTITNAIKYAMDDQGLNISELAGQMGFSVTYVAKLLRGDKRWNENTLQKALYALNLEIEINPAKKKRRKVVAND